MLNMQWFYRVDSHPIIRYKGHVFTEIPRNCESFERFTPRAARMKPALHRKVRYLTTIINFYV